MMEEARAFLERGTAVLAERIQLSVLPPVLAFPGFEVAARMQPGEVVGGDYYNVRATSDGIWLAIGDVSGYGVTAGLITLLTHGILTGLGIRSADTSPAPIVRTLNELLVEHLARVGVSEHMTFSLLTLRNDGRLVWAGAHEDLLVLRARTGRCERLRTVGTWLGVVHHASEYMVDAEAALEPGDLLCAPTSHRL